MKSPVVSSMLTIPITSRERRLAEQFKVQHAQPEIAEQVYRNTLAVWAVNYYCQCLEIPTNLEESDSWDSVMQSLSDTADLNLPGIGRLECRPVASGATTVEIPAEVWGDRISYLAVQFDETFSQAHILGFLNAANSEKISLEELQPLEELATQLNLLRKNPEFVSVTHLSNWLKGVVEVGWEKKEVIEEILFKTQPELGLSFRYESVDQPEIEQAKLLKFEPIKEQFALFVGLTPIAEEVMNIVVELCPLSGSAQLPADLQLLVLDDTGKTVMQAEAGRSEKLQFKFGGKTGEQFSIAVILREMRITEVFKV